MTIKVAAILILAIALTSCGAPQVLVNVTAVLNGIAALQAALPAAGVSPSLAKQIADYASAAATGTSQCATVLAMGGDTAVMAAKCGQFLAAAVQPVLPAGTPQNVAGLVATVYAEIQVVYATIEAGQAGTKPTGVVKTAAVSKAEWHPGKSEANRLRDLAARAAKLARG